MSLVIHSAVTKGEMLDQSPLGNSDLEFAKWIKFAAPAFSISPNVDDYFFTTTVLLTSDIVNRNGVGVSSSGWPTHEVTGKKPGDPPFWANKRVAGGGLAAYNAALGRQAYAGWRGMPLHVEHKSEDPHQAIGVVADVSMRPIEGFNGNRIYKIVGLCAVDTTKRVDITSKIVTGERNSWSMGMMVDGYSCSYCHAEEGNCHHIDEDKPFVCYEKNGILVFRKVHGVTPFEFSNVEVGAFPSALSDPTWGFWAKKKI